MALPKFVPSFSATSIALFESLLNNIISASTYDDMRASYEAVDKDYSVSKSKYTPEQLQAIERGDYSKLDSFELPLIFPAVETSVAQQVNAFFSQVPIFPVVPSQKYTAATKMLETIIESNATDGGWTEEFSECFRDAEKYNKMFAEVAWEVKSARSLEYTQENNTLLPAIKKVYWEGNTVKRLDPYNTFYDTSVPLHKLTKDGVYAGYHEPISKIALIKHIFDISGLIKSQQKAVYESTAPANLYYVPTFLDEFNLRNVHNTSRIEPDWEIELGSDNSKIAYSGEYIKTVLYIRIIPREYKLSNIPGPKTPQIWKLTFINKILLAAKPENYLHDFLPIVAATALKTQKSSAQYLAPFQQINTSLMGSVVAARRKAINDRVVYDPSKISPKLINNSNPASKIPVRPAAYGQPVGQHFVPIPFNDSTSQQSISLMGIVTDLAYKTIGQNPTLQGQFVKGNKSVTEFASTMSGGSARESLKSLIYETSFFTPVKTMLKSNILQFQGVTTLFSRKDEDDVQIDPKELQKAVLTFQILDGRTTKSDVISDAAWSVAMQTMLQVPSIGSKYDIPDIFAYLMAAKGADIADFKKPAWQIQYEQAVSIWQQQMQQILEGLKQANISPQGISFPPQPLPQQFAPQQNG